MSFFLQNNLLIIVIYTYVLFYLIKDTDYTQMLLLTFVTGFLICKNKNIETFDDDNDNDDDDDDDDKFTLENTNSTTYDGSPDYIKNLSNKSINDNDDDDTTNNLIERQSDIDIKAFNNIMRMGPYDSLCLTSLKNKNKYGLVPNSELQTYFGVQGPLQTTTTNNDVLTGPPVDGNPKSPQKMAIFSNNQVSGNCCNDSHISTSNGCVCITPQQKKWIQSRGYNKTYYNELI